MKSGVPVLILFSLLLAGCGGSFWQKAEEAAQPGPSKAEIAAKVKPLIEPFRQVTNTGTAGPGLLPEARDLVINGLRDAQLQYGAYPAGQEVLRELGYEIVDIAKRARDQERWRLVEACVDAHEILNLDNAMISRLDARAQEVLSRPTVEVKGFIDDGEKKITSIFLRITDRTTGRMKSLTAREGDEFDELKVINIVGNNKAVRFEYKKIPGLVFEVDGPNY